jgi:hypothetical protein
MSPRTPRTPKHLLIPAVALGVVLTGGAPPVAQETSPPANEQVQAQAPEATPTPRPIPKPLVIPASGRPQESRPRRWGDQSGKNLTASAPCHGMKARWSWHLALSLKMKILNLADPKVQGEAHRRRVFTFSGTVSSTPAEKLVDRTSGR